MRDREDGLIVSMTALDPCVLRVPLVRAAACADSTNAVRSHLEPLRVFPEKRLPADSLLPGHMPAQEAFRRPLGGEQIRQESPFIPARLPGAHAVFIPVRATWRRDRLKSGPASGNVSRETDFSGGKDGAF
jgi:hypothetical protein